MGLGRLLILKHKEGKGDAEAYPLLDSDKITFIYMVFGRPVFLLKMKMEKYLKILKKDLSFIPFDTIMYMKGS
ncbi:MAG: hypothetical protein ACRC36_20135 [Lacrimispora sphenoides]